MLLSLKLSAQECCQLQRLADTTNNPRLQKRLAIIKLAGGQVSVTQISQTLHLCEATVRRTIHLFEKKGFSGLQPARTKKSGRPRKIDQSILVVIQKFATHGKTMSEIQNWLATCHKLQVHQKTIKRALIKLAN